MACVSLKRLREANALNQRSAKRQRRGSFGMLNSNVVDNVENSNMCAIEPKPSPFAESNVNKISPNTLDQNIRLEIRRLHKLKQLTCTSSNESLHNSDAFASQMMVDNCNTQRSSGDNKALFNYKQVQLICQRMLQDQENKLREEYETVLRLKLADQYDAFVKFTYDQIQHRFQATPSYLS